MPQVLGFVSTFHRLFGGLYTILAKHRGFKEKIKQAGDLALCLTACHFGFYYPFA